MPTGSAMAAVGGAGDSPMAAYQPLLTPESAQRLEGFTAAHPGKDPTEVDDLQEAFMEERGRLGRVLDDSTAASLAALMREWEALQAEAVLRRAELAGLAVERARPDGGRETLVGFQEGRPVYVGTQNYYAAVSTNAARVRMTPGFDPLLGDSVSGSGLYVNVNDHGTIYDENPEFQLPNSGGTRVVFKEIYDDGERSHMTHVAGTVGAWGYDPLLQGMAPRVWIRSLIQQSTSDVNTWGMRYPGELHTALNPRTGQTEMRSVMGTTSLGGEPAGPNYGVYSSSSLSFDQVLWDYPYYIHFYAAGNYGGFSRISEGNNLAKNVLTIAAVTDVTRDAGGNSTGGGSKASFSSQGPAYDGRIKPDFSANGVGLLSPSSATGSKSEQGTSMATPNASGSTVLLIDYFNRKFPGHFLRSSTLKALLANTADDRGDAGPDYTYGWGIINVEAAAKIVKAYAETPSGRPVVEDELPLGATWSATYTSNGTGPVRVTLAWIDPPHPTSQSTITENLERTPRLVNNLNIRLIAPDGATTHMPYVMPFTTGQGGTPAYDDTLRGADAVTGDNFTDNCEQIFVAAPQAGNYTIQVSHAGALKDGAAQKFSLAVTGLARSGPLAASVSSVTPAEIEPASERQLTVSGTGFVLGSDVILRRSGEPEAVAYAVEVVGGRIDCRIDGGDLSPGKYDVVVRAPDGSEAELPGGFLVLGNTETLYTNGFNSAGHGVTLEGVWTVGAPAYSSWITTAPQSAAEGTGILGTAISGSGNYPNSANISARLPAINATGKSALRLSFQQWLRVQSGDTASIEVSTNGTSWTTVWSNVSFYLNSSWGLVTHDLPASLDNQPTVYVRFRLQSNSSGQEIGWNIDDLRITAQGANKQPPAFTSTPVTTGTINQPYSYVVTTTDPDTAAGGLVLTATGLPPGLVLTPNGAGGARLSGTPTAHGNYLVRLTVADGNYETHQEFGLFIQPAGGNNAPVITTTSLPNAYIGAAYSATIAVSDADGHPAAITADGLPNWLALTDHGNNTATISGTPPLGSNLVYPITFTASDGAATAQKSLTLTVGQRAVIGLTATSAGVSESSGQVVFTVSRTVGSSGNVTVDFTTSAGSATAPDDFTATSGTLSWADGDMADKSITVPITADSIREMTESFTLSLSNLTGVADMATSTATITVQDDDVPPGQAIALGPLYLLEGGSVAESGGVRTLTRTGANLLQGYAGNLPALPGGGELAEVGDFIELAFTINPNTPNNKSRQVSCGFFNGNAVASDAERATTDAWTGLIHQLGTRTSSTTGAAAMRQGAGSMSLMDHVGGTTSVNGTSSAPSISSLNPTTASLVRVRIERINATQVRMVSTFPTGSSAGSASGTSGSGNALISWSYTTTGGVCEFRSVHNIAAGPSPAVFNRFAIASQGDLWTLGDLAASSNIGQTLQPAAPVITAHPQSQTVETGGTLVLGVTATGNPAPAYQWRKGGTPIAGATASTYTKSNVQPGDAGTYDVVVTNSVGSATSDAATVTISAPNTPPEISPLDDQSVVSGQSTLPLAFTVADAETPAAALDVSASSSNATLLPASGIVLGGAGANRTITLTPAAGETGSALVTVVVDDGSLSASASFTLTVTPAPNPGTIGLSATTYSLGENQGPATITVTRSGGSAGAVSVSYSTADASAQSGTDYAAASGTLTWVDGETGGKSFAVALLDDGIEEPAESFQIHLASPTNGAVLGTSSATVTIFNDDDNSPPVNEATWPKADTATAVGFTVRARTNEAGTAYFVVLPDAATAPTAAQVKAGGGADQAAIESGTILLAANTEGAATVSGLQPGAAYDLYVVAEDSASNLQAAPAKLDAATAGDELVAWWKMNENSGAVAADSSGNSRNATLGGAVAWDAAGRSGAALSFNGSNTTANRATFTSPANPGRLLTVSGWFKAASIASGSYPRLISTPAYEILLVGSGVSGNTMCLAYAHQRGSAADSWRTPTNSVPVGEWVHIAVVHDATSTSTAPVIYLNGVAATLTKANNGSGNLPATFEGASYLGNRAAGDRGFHGLLDDWRIHHRLLAPAEIPALPATVFAGWVAGQSGAGSLTGPNDDPDGDGVVNLLEYALGGSPGPADAGRLPVAATHQTAPGESYLSLSIRRNANAKDVGYIVEVSGDLVTWTGGASATTVLMDTPESLVVRDNTPLENAPRRFIRLRVESNR